MTDTLPTNREDIVAQDEEEFALLREKGNLDKLRDQIPEYQTPSDRVLAFTIDTFMRKDTNQIVFYKRSFLDVWTACLKPEQAVILASFDGKNTIADVAEQVREITGGLPELADFKVRRVLEQVNALKPGKGSFVDLTANPGTPFRTYNPAAFASLAGPLRREHRLEKPVALMWMPTWVCETDCIYCYATRRPIKQGDLLPDERVKEIFDEAADIGIVTVNVDGGDAFCRPNIVELLAHGSSRGLAFDLSTKGYASPEFARRLRDAGVTRMQYGFDAPFPDLFDETVGRKGHFQRTVESIHNCHNAGLSVRTNSILTSKSYRYIHELMDLLHTLPLFNMKFAPAFRSIHRPRPDLLLTEEQKQWLRAQIDLLKEKYPQGKINFECRSDYRDLSAEAREKEFHGFPRCGVNRFCMIVAPDGAVIGCEQAPQTADFILGNVKERSLLDVWQSDRVTGFINVTREQFKGTVCEDCETFAQCYDNKGGCFIESIRAYGSRFAPHPLCPKAPGYELAVH